MFCKYCGNELEESAIFCSKCGKQHLQENTSKNDDSTSSQQNENFSSDNSQSDSVSAFGKNVTNSFSKINPFCIVGIILTALSFFIDLVGVFAYSALVFSIVGYRSAMRYNERGKTGAVIAICISAFFSLIQIIMTIVWLSEYGIPYTGGIISLFL